MPTLIQKLLQRSDDAWSPEDLEKLASIVAAERGRLESLVTELEPKFAVIEQSKDRLDTILEEVIRRSQEAKGDLARFQSRSEALHDAESRVGGLDERLDHFELQFGSLVGEQKELNRTTRRLEERLQNLQDAGSGLLADFDKANVMAAGLDEVLISLSAGRELARKNDEQLRNLHALWEHIDQKMGLLENSKQIIERVEAQNREVEEAVSRLDRQVTQVSEESRLIESSDEEVKRLEAMLGALQRDLEHASKEKENLQGQSDNLSSEVTTTLDSLRSELNRSEFLREDLDTVNDRVEALFKQLRNQEDLTKAMEARGEELIAAGLETKELIAKAASLSERFDAIDERMGSVDDLETRLGSLGEMGRKVDQQIESIDKRQTLVNATDERLSDLSSVFSEVKEMLADLESQRQELDQTLELFGEFRSSTVEIRGRIQELDGDFVRINDVEQRLEEMRRLVETLEGSAVDLEPRVEFVEGVESRLNHLDSLSQQVDGRIESQLATQSDLESMKHSQEGLAQQLEDLKKLATALQSSPKLATMEQRLTELEDRIQISSRRLERMESLEKSLVENEKRLESVTQGLHESQGALDSHTTRLETLKEQGIEAQEAFSGWMDGVARLEARQRELGEQAEVTDTRLREVRDLHDKLEDDIEVLAERERQSDRHIQKLQTFEGLIRDLDRKVEAVNSRHAVVDRVKKDVQKVLHTVDESRAQALEVLNARQEIAEVGNTVTDVDSQVKKLENRLDGVQDQLSAVDKAEIKIDALNHVVSDIDANLGHFEGQKAMVEHLVEKIATLEALLRQADATARELREERQLAFRIQKSVGSPGNGGLQGPTALTVIESEEPPTEVELETSQSA
ncbi:MAG: hypothetical protein WBO69_06840 [Thermoanaerobaculia bacterium]|jgi:chromosome segregation ATPase